MENKIIRRPDFAGGGITDEEKIKLDQHAQMWISRAFRTEQIEPDKIIPAIKSLYAAADLAEPIVVIVPSPKVMAIAGGIAAAFWGSAKATHQVTYQATYLATALATALATGLATRQATHLATREATDQVTAQATLQATREATRQVTAQATDQVTYQATYRATYLATALATHLATDQATHQATALATREAPGLATCEATGLATCEATDKATYLATDRATRQATDQATDLATRQATDQATHQATYQATDLATHQATDQVTDLATRQATYQATHQATYQATYRATRRATGKAATQVTDEDQSSHVLDICNYFGVPYGDAKNEIGNWYSYYQGGNFWAGWACYLSAMRDVIGLQLKEHDKYKSWDDCAINGGPRFMHKNFCMVCDFPEYIKTDEKNRPHCIDGPSHRWRDGWEIYNLWGVMIDKEMLYYSPEQILKVKNAEQRMVLMKRIGINKFVEKIGSKTIDKYKDYELILVPIENRKCEFLKMVNPSTGEIHIEGVPPKTKTVQEALAWRRGVTVYTNPIFTA